MVGMERQGMSDGPAGRGGADSSDDANGRTVRYRLSTAQFALPLTSALLLGELLFQGIPLVTGEPVTVAGIRNHLGVIGLAALGVLVLPRPEAVTATPRFVTFAKGDRGRADWTDVRDITVRRSAGIDRVRVSLRDGRSVFLRAPISLLDRQFDQKTEELQDFLQTSRLNGGADTD